jgi:hypothetical protein
LAPAKIEHTAAISLTGAVSTEGNASKIVLNIACNSKQPVRCDSEGARAELRSSADLQAAANELSSASSPAGQYIRKLSTTKPAGEPHKIYGLADLLENFYRRQLPDARSSFAAVEFCEE